MGKNTPEDERNCEGCGYKSCRDKARAVLAGMSVPEMCVPNMRAKAESSANIIVRSTPNAIIVLDEEMRVLDYNPAAERLFREIPFRKGLELQQHMDIRPYETALQRKVTEKEARISYPRWGLVTRQITIPLGETGHVMGIITDITEMEREQEQVRKMKEEVVSKAREVLNRQMTVAQTIAGLLGETTADTKATLLELLRHLDGDRN